LVSVMMFGMEVQVDWSTTSGLGAAAQQS